MVNDNPDTREAVDLGIRRTRILMHGQITPKLLVFRIIGVSDQSFATLRRVHGNGRWAADERTVPAGLALPERYHLQHRETVGINPDGTVYPKANHDERLSPSDRRRCMPIIVALLQCCAGGVAFSRRGLRASR
jgi:hypothetical protein